MQKNLFKNAKRIVIKVGSSLLVGDGGRVRKDWLYALAEDVAALHKSGKDVVIVTSGAVAVGRKPLGLSGKLSLKEKQAVASVGQMRLMHDYEEALADFGIVVSQVLLGLEDSDMRQRYLNACNTLDTLLSLRVVPVINENDTTATEEIRFGDNDRLAARVSQMVGADILVLFSDIDGLYTKDPNKNPDAEFIPIVEEVTPEIEEMAGVSGSNFGTGGMITKLMAAKICMNAGCHMAITKGKGYHSLNELMQSSRQATWFVAPKKQIAAKKKWIAGFISPNGKLFLDEGAVKAVKNGKSILPAGVIKIEGNFAKGDIILVCDKSGATFAKGVIAYSSTDAQKIIGKSSKDFASILGYEGKNDIIHRDYLVLEV